MVSVAPPRSDRQDAGSGRPDQVGAHDDDGLAGGPLPQRAAAARYRADLAGGQLRNRKVAASEAAEEAAQTSLKTPTLTPSAPGDRSRTTKGAGLGPAAVDASQAPATDEMDPVAAAWQGLKAPAHAEAVAIADQLKGCYGGQPLHAEEIVCMLFVASPAAKRAAVADWLAEQLLDYSKGRLVRLLGALLELDMSVLIYLGTHPADLVQTMIAVEAVPLPQGGACVESAGKSRPVDGRMMQQKAVALGKTAAFTFCERSGYLAAAEAGCTLAALRGELERVGGGRRPTVRRWLLPAVRVAAISWGVSTATLDGTCGDVVERVLDGMGEDDVLELVKRRGLPSVARRAYNGEEGPCARAVRRSARGRRGGRGAA